MISFLTIHLQTGIHGPSCKSCRYTSRYIAPLPLPSCITVSSCTTLSLPESVKAPHIFYWRYSLPPTTLNSCDGIPGCLYCLMGILVSFDQTSTNPSCKRHHSTPSHSMFLIWDLSQKPTGQAHPPLGYPAMQSIPYLFGLKILTDRTIKF